MTEIIILAQDEAANPLISLMPFILLILLFYLILIRPQRRRVQQHAELVRSVQVGDEVETIGGIFGRVKRMDDEHVWLEIASDTTVKVTRSAVRRRVSDTPAAPGSS